MTLNSKTLREKYIKFFEARGHRAIPSASLLPENDPTVLFTTAGMHPLVPYLMGQPHPAGRRLVNVQKCIRTQDIDEVGDSSHCTFFEMLGNWSLGDYFKKEAITWSYEFLTQELKLPLSKLAVTVFAGEPGIPADTESAAIWQSLGMPKEKIFALPRAKNWWGPAGQTGPCGPDTEMFFITRESCAFNDPACSPACDCGKYLEIWNDVFMEYEKTADGAYIPLKQKCVDTGMGLIRVVGVLNGNASVYDSEVFSEAMQYLSKAGASLGERERRIIADHLHTALFAIGDGVLPSNVGSGYIVRRILRRAFRLANQVQMESQYIDAVIDRMVTAYGDAYPETMKRRTEILAAIHDEEEKFGKALGQGLKYFEKELSTLSAAGSKTIAGRTAFYMFETFGFPLEVTQEIAKERGMAVDVEEYNKAFTEHQDKSRLAGEKLFKGGLADNSAESTRLHTATHLLHEALRRVLGTHVQQKGSNITVERLRFDFSHTQKMTKEELQKVEDIVNEQITRNLEVKIESMTLAEAKDRGAIGLFEDRYGERINVYFMGDFSKEVCGGPHVQHLAELGRFKIQKEEASSAGVRRIKAIVTGPSG